MEPEKKSNGALIGSIIVILILIIGAVYFWMTSDKIEQLTEEQKAVVESYDDLTTVDMELEQELNSVESELDQNLDASTLQ